MRQVAKYYAILGKQTFSPLDLSPALWLDASDTATITASSGSVSQWNDKSGNARHVTQGTAAAQPTTAAAAQNGLNVLSFDGGDALQGGDVLDLGTNSLSVFLVARRASGVHGTLIGKYKVSPAAGSWLMLFESPPAEAVQLRSVYIDDVGSKQAAQQFTSTGYNVIGEITNRSAGTITQRINKATAGTQTFTADSASSRDTATQLTIGQLLASNGVDFIGSYGLAGAIAEIVVCLAALNDTDRDKLETYLKDKWGTP
jgi:hypothetical protein